MWLLQLLYGLKLCFYIQTYLKYNLNVKYTDLYEYIITTKNHSNTLIKREINYFTDITNGILNGKESSQLVEDFARIYWVPEEASYLKLSLEDKFFDEIYEVIQTFLNEKNIQYNKEELKEVCEYQKLRVPSLYKKPLSYKFNFNIPEYFDNIFEDTKTLLIPKQQTAEVIDSIDYGSDKREFAKKVVLWGRKSNGMINKIEWKNNE